jgi:hypothetical protein
MQPTDWGPCKIPCVAYSNIPTCLNICYSPPYYRFSTLREKHVLKHFRFLALYICVRLNKIVWLVHACELVCLCWVASLQCEYIHSWSWDLLEKLPSNCAATQELLSILWNSKVHYHVYESPLLFPILSQINPDYTFPSYLRSILILSTHLHLGLPSGLFPSGFPTNILHKFFFSAIHATCPAQLILLDLIILIILGKEYNTAESY